jgi:hypothetical protein
MQSLSKFACQFFKNRRGNPKIHVAPQKNLNNQGHNGQKEKC